MTKEVDRETRLIAKLILERLDNMDKWGGAHSEFARVKKSLPSYITDTNKGKKQISRAIKFLLNLGFVLIKLSTGEPHVSLNPRKKKEIYGFIEKNEKTEYKI